MILKRLSFWVRIPLHGPDLRKHLWVPAFFWGYLERQCWIYPQTSCQISNTWPFHPTPLLPWQFHLKPSCSKNRWGNRPGMPCLPSKLKHGLLRLNLPIAKFDSFERSHRGSHEGVSLLVIVTWTKKSWLETQGPTNFGVLKSIPAWLGRIHYP